MDEDVILREGGPDDEVELDRMLRAYTAEIAEFSDRVDRDRPLEPEWTRHPGLRPFLIERARAPVGIALVMGREYAATQGEDVDWVVYDYFVEPELRGTGIAERAAHLLFDRLTGDWAIAVQERNGRALAFWRKVIAARGEHVETTPGVEGLPTYRFRS